MGLYGALQQHTLNRANAYAAEALAQPLAVAARVDMHDMICAHVNLIHDMTHDMHMSI